MDRTGTFLGVTKSLPDAVERARRAEQLGYESVWITQTASRDSLLVLSEYARATSHVRLGTGVIPIYSRPPAVMAQQAATLNEISGGRYVLGIGVSHRPAVESYFGQDYVRPLSAMREYLTIVRGILRDGGIAFQGERFRTSFAFLGFTPPPTPVYISALSPKMCRLAGELADGVVLWLCTPDYVRDHVLPNVRAGAEQAGRDPAQIEIVTAIPVFVTDDPGAARTALRRDLFVYWTLPNYRAVVERSGFAGALEQFDKALASAGPDAAREEIPDAFLDSLAGFGEASAVGAKVEEYREKGATLPAVGPFGRGAIATLEALAR